MRWRWIGLATAAMTVAFVAWYPGHRLDEELAGARREGIPTSFVEWRGETEIVPDGQNAALAIRLASAPEGNMPALGSPLDARINRFFLHGGSESERAALRWAFVERSWLLKDWLSASRRPRIDYHRAWNAPSDEFPEQGNIRWAVVKLIVAARVGLSKDENLRAAARLSALTRQEPTIIAQFAGIQMGRIALRATQEADRLRKTESELGEPTDLRAALRLEMARTLDAMRLEEGAGLIERLRHSGPLKSNAISGAVAQFRRLMRELPDDPNDFRGAAKTLDRRMPEIRRALGNYSPELIHQKRDMTGIEMLARECARYADERATLTLRP